MNVKFIRRNADNDWYPTITLKAYLKTAYILVTYMTAYAGTVARHYH